jgi:uroporphyrinogen decarboxylase
MPMTPREVVARTIRFEGADRLPLDLPEKYGCDWEGVGMDPSPDARPSTSAVDEWGAVWENIGVCGLGEVKDFPLKSWSDFDKLNIPDIKEEHRWKNLDGARDRAGDKFLSSGGISIYERVHFVHGLENTWIDIHENEEELGRFIDILVDMNLYAIDRYAEQEVDGFMFCDDWGLQTRLMIKPEDWRRIWKPRYARIYKAAHDAGMLTLLHSCGHIVDILDDLIEVGLDVIQMDQQENMGLQLLSDRFRGRIAFWNPVDIQYTMARANLDEIRAYARRMVELLGTPDGGYLTKWYGDPVGAGHTQEAIDAMSEEFLLLSEEHHQRWLKRHPDEKD